MAAAERLTTVVIPYHLRGINIYAKIAEEIREVVIPYHLRGINIRE